MEKLENFKKFVKENPNLVKHVKNNDMTWQKFYEIYDLYGSDNEVWNEYINKTNDSVIEKELSSKSVNNLFNVFKGINLDSLQEGIGSIQRVLEMLGDISTSSSKETEYKPRPLYKHFDD